MYKPYINGLAPMNFVQLTFEFHSITHYLLASIIFSELLAEDGIRYPETFCIGLQDVSIINCYVNVPGMLI